MEKREKNKREFFSFFPTFFASFSSPFFLLARLFFSSHAVCLSSSSSSPPLYPYPSQNLNYFTLSVSILRQGTLRLAIEQAMILIRYSFFL